MGHAALRPAVFLDRDGTIIEDVHYCGRPEDVIVLPGAARAIALLNRVGLPVVMVTNQSGISRGYFDWEMLEAIHAGLRRTLIRDGARIDAIYVCPHHPHDGCACRKPRPGLLLRAAADLGLELSRSYMVGDQDSDVLAGHAYGCTSGLLEAGPFHAGPAEAGATTPDFRAGNLYAAAQWIARHARLHASAPVAAADSVREA